MIWKAFFEKTGKNILLALGILLFLSNTTTQAGEADADNRQKPNIVFVLVDDLGWTDINIFDPLKRNFYETPNIDKLANQGMMFTQAYSNAANCAPSRAALLSGQYYPHQPIYHVGSPGKGKLIPAPNATALPLGKVTLAEALKQAGYHTAFMGKWHIGSPPETGPRQQGFDVNIGGYNSGNPSVWDGEYFKPNNNPYIHDAKEGEYLTYYLTRKASEYIKAHQKGPFYLQLSYFTPHTPLQAPEKTVQKYKRKEGDRGHNHATYAAMIDILDRNVGKLMQTTRDIGIDNNTIFIFFSDNGGVGGYDYLGRPNSRITDHAPLKGGKTTYYEGGIRVPLIVRWPEVVEPGSQCSEPVIGTDFYPTLVAAAGMEEQANYLLDGKNLMPLLKGQKSFEDQQELYWHFPGYPNVTWRTSPVSVIRYGPWKLMKFYEEYYQSGKVELYNLENDIGEKNDLAEERPAIRQDLQNRLQIWLESNNAPTPRVRRKTSENNN